MKITVIGELCKDRFVYGETKRLSPEAPIPVLNPIHIEENDGMAGNVVQNLLALNNKLQISFIHQEEKIIKTRYVDEKSNHMFLRVDEETQVETLSLTDEYIEVIKESDAVIVSDYNKGFLDEDVLNEITYHSHFSIMDTKKQINLSILTLFNFIKLNESEFLKHTINDHWLEKLLITLGSRGARYKDKIYPSPEPKETIDVSGAGDTFTASFTLKYLETKNIEESIIFANKMASIVVSKRGVAKP
jgi:D-beta-D-heptose 7-phosphate kinase/D-beta-D-heptose 1-phosphate adenosyltransferase